MLKGSEKGLKGLNQSAFGFSEFSNDNFGWAGHTEEGGSISNVSGNID